MKGLFGISQGSIAVFLGGVQGVAELVKLGLALKDEQYR